MPAPPSVPRAPPYIVTGKSYDPADNLQVGAKVKITDLNLNETRTKITDANGEYIDDSLNMPSKYSDGDILKIECEARGYCQTKIHTVNTPNLGTEQVFDKNTTFIMMVM